MLLVDDGDRVGGEGEAETAQRVGSDLSYAYFVGLLGLTNYGGSELELIRDTTYRRTSSSAAN